jgi:predicted AlkP superfamily phosphohydrolase/phosphomutase
MVMIGFDYGSPELLFGGMQTICPYSPGCASVHLGPLESAMPPVTVPAWSCMLSGRTPGELGVYGFRNRADHGYDAMAFATSRSIRPLAN